jgi:hypothetical protein
MGPIQEYAAFCGGIICGEPYPKSWPDIPAGFWEGVGNVFPDWYTADWKVHALAYAFLFTLAEDQGV